jgi:predicted DNA repair protein MutK
MIWVGGGIILHGLELYAPPAIGLAIKAAAEAIGYAFPFVPGVLERIVEAAISAAAGLVVGAASMLMSRFVFSPTWKLLMSYWQARQKAA